MPESKTQIPADIARYLQGAPAESQQFDFLIGNWVVSATRYGEDGVALFKYEATWNAQYLNEGRMVIDDFQAKSPTGQVVSSFVTLRTYSQDKQRWEMVGLAALQPAVSAEWYGQWQNGEMLTNATGKDPAGNSLRNRIRFFNITGNSFEWESRVSRDEGQTWSRIATLLASRAA
jgi:hypothetical protein